MIIPQVNLGLPSSIEKKHGSNISSGRANFFISCDTQQQLLARHLYYRSLVAACVDWLLGLTVDGCIEAEDIKHVRAL